MLKNNIFEDNTELISVVKQAVEHVPGVIRLTSGDNFAQTIAYMLGRAQAKPDSVKIKNSGKELYISVKIIISYGKNIHEIGLKAQMSIANSIKAAFLIEPTRIDICVENVENEDSI